MDAQRQARNARDAAIRTPSPDPATPSSHVSSPSFQPPQSVSPPTSPPPPSSLPRRAIPSSPQPNAISSTNTTQPAPPSQPDRRAVSSLPRRAIQKKIPSPAQPNAIASTSATQPDPPSPPVRLAGFRAPTSRRFELPADYESELSTAPPSPARKPTGIGKGKGKAKPKATTLPPRATRKKSTRK